MLGNDEIDNGEILLGPCWYTNFWVPAPPPPLICSNTSVHRQRLEFEALKKLYEKYSERDAGPECVAVVTQLLRVLLACVALQPTTQLPPFLALLMEALHLGVTFPHPKVCAWALEDFALRKAAPPGDVAVDLVAGLAV